MRPDNEAVSVVCGRVFLNVLDFKTMRPGRFLSDSIVEAGIRHCLEASPRPAAYLPRLYKVLDKTPWDLPLQTWYRSIERQLGNNNLVIIPICWLRHWTVAFLDRQSSKLVHFNSLCNDDHPYHPTDILDRIVEVFSKFFNPVKNVQLVCKRDIQNQPNTFDCGVFVIEFVKQALFGEGTIDLDALGEYRSNLVSLLRNFVRFDSAGILVLGPNVHAGLEVNGDEGLDVDEGLVVDEGLDVDGGLVVDVGLDVDGGLVVDEGLDVNEGHGDDMGVQADGGNDDNMNGNLVGEGNGVVVGEDLGSVDRHSLSYQASLTLLATGEQRQFLGRDINNKYLTYNNPHRDLRFMLSFSEACFTFGFDRFKTNKLSLLNYLSTNPVVAQTWLENHVRDKSLRTIFNFKFDDDIVIPKVKRFANSV